jgi:hypothetical protein
MNKLLISRLLDVVIVVLIVANIYHWSHLPEAPEPGYETNFWFNSVEEVEIPMGMG